MRNGTRAILCLLVGFVGVMILRAAGIPQAVASPHNPMLDEQGRVWWSADTVTLDTDDREARQIAIEALLSHSHGMQLGYYDTKTGKFVPVDTSYTHHLQLDWQGRVWTDGDVLGMLDTTKLDLNNVPAPRAPLKKPGCAWT